ncbi:hypothetical protein ACFT7S_28630 [Streptomyces sp. NPDC057136]|uniref:hypothetical protein n=1 Tax=Streptomyces sp. NPDC057136 TaxID=3346029 RepID=UPI003625D7E9
MHNNGSSGEVVLAADFPMSGRGEAGFSDFAPLLDPSLAVWETLPPADGKGRVSGREYVERWLDGVRESNLEVRAVLSFCAGAAFVGALTDGIAEWQGRAPEIIMFDPEVPTALTLHTQFVRAIDRFSVFFSPEETARMHAGAQRVYAENGHDIELLLDAVSGLYRKIGDEGFAKAGIDPKYGAGLIEVFNSFARYLVAGAQLDPRPGWKRATAISSSTTTSGLHLVSATERGGLVGNELRLDVHHTQLLSSEECARAVTELLGRASA